MPLAVDAGHSLDALSCLATGYCYADTGTALVGFAQGVPAAIDQAQPQADGNVLWQSCVAGPVCVQMATDGFTQQLS